MNNKKDVVVFSGKLQICIQCKQEIAIELFEKRADTGKYRNQCKSCRASYVKEWKEENVEKIVKLIPLCKECNETRTYKPKCFRCKQKDVMRERYGSDLSYKLKVIHRNRISSAVKGYNINLQDVERYIGCSWFLFISWLEYLFDEGMTWENYGSYWHIDHVLPLNNFVLSNESERKICFHWTNLQPKTQVDNCRKNDKIRVYEYFNIFISLHRFHQIYKIDSVYQSMNESLCWLRENLEVKMTDMICRYSTLK